MKSLITKRKSYREGGPLTGFTIIELVISIFILSIAVIGIFNALSVIIILTSDSTDRLTATYLAQEGMEIARNIRDTNWLNMDAAAANNNIGQVYSWVDGLVSQGNGADNNGVICSAQQPCEADYTYNYMHNGQDKLCLNTNGFYYYTNSCPPGSATKFIRQIIITPIVDVDNNSTTYHIIKVKVEVSWDRKATVLSGAALATSCGATNCITTEETLYNWYNTTISVASVVITDPLNAYPETNTANLSINGASDIITANISPTNATNKSVSWSVTVNGVLDNSVVRVASTGVDSNGNPTATIAPVGSGSAVVTVTTADGSKTYYDNFYVASGN